MILTSHDTLQTRYIHTSDTWSPSYTHIINIHYKHDTHTHTHTSDTSYTITNIIHTHHKHDTYYKQITNVTHTYYKHDWTNLFLGLAKKFTKS